MIFKAYDKKTIAKNCLKWYAHYWKKPCGQIHKIKQKIFFYGIFYSWLFAVSYQNTSIAFWVAGWALIIKSRRFRIFF